MVLTESDMILKYKDQMQKSISLIYPEMKSYDLDKILDYSIKKRFHDTPVRIDNSYKKKEANSTLLGVADYIERRKPIVTAYGTMFMHHEETPNPLAKVVDMFLNARSVYKKKMFKYPKGSEMFEKYNLLQLLTKVDTNAIYGTIGMYSSLLYNNNTATSITSQGRALTSSATMLFEGFLANNVKFSSLNELVEYIDHIIIDDKSTRRFNTFNVLDSYWYITREDLFARLVMNCDFNWIPNEKELDIIWHICWNLNQEEVNRVYYKNHLYAFLDNCSVLTNLVDTVLKTLNRPFMGVSDIPVNIEKYLIQIKDLLAEYVYYPYMFIDRIDKTLHMIRSVIMVSDTDSTIISLDAWYRYFANKFAGRKYKIVNDYNPYIKEGSDYYQPIKFLYEPIHFMEKTYDYNFKTDEIIEEYREKHQEMNGYNNMRISILSIMGYVLDYLINDYMVKFCKNVNSINDKRGPENCRILMKNEFEMRRMLMTQVKKSYVSLIEIQEGNLIPYEKQMTVSGIECMAKSTKSKYTRDALKKITEEDIMRAPMIDQLKFLKDITILEKRIEESIRSGSKEYYKPVKIKAATAYENPMGQQGIKASVAWNNIREKGYPAIDLRERNPIDIVKVNINRATIEKIKDTYPEVYENILKTLDQEAFQKKNKDGKVIENDIKAIAIPLDTEVPKWITEFVDYKSIVSNNIQGYPYASIGIVPGNKNSNTSYSNIIQF